MKRLLLSCVVALSMVAGAASADDADSDSTAGADAAPANAIKLESKSIDLFADVLVVSDIGGRTDGVYDDANAALLSAIAHDTKTILADNVAIADVKLSTGMLLGDGRNLVYVKAGKTIEDKFAGHATADSLDTLAPKESMPFFQGLVSNRATAPTYNAFSGRKRGQSHAANYPVTMPAGGLGGSSRYLLFLQTSARHVPAGKSISIGVLTSLATGGTYSRMPMSGGLVSVALIDKQSSRVLWAMQRPVKDFNQLQIVAIRLMAALSKALPSDGTAAAGNIAANSPEVINANAAPEYRSLKDVKLALRAGTIDRAEYDRIAKTLESQYHAVLDGLKKKQQSGEISDTAFEILSVKSELEYTGASSG